MSGKHVLPTRASAHALPAAPARPTGPARTAMAGASSPRAGLPEPRTPGAGDRRSDRGRLASPTPLRWRASIAILAASLVGLLGAPLANAASPSALILGTSVVRGSARDGTERSLEQQQAEADGFTVTVASAPTWEAMSASEFAKYQVLIIGDPKCEGEEGYAAAQANANVWQLVVMSSGGNKVLIGTDPTFHNNGPTGKHRGDLLEARGIAYAGALAGRTGAYVDTSCEFSNSDNEEISVPPGTPVPIMDGLSTHGPGQFTAGGAPCAGNISIVAATGPTEGLHDADLSEWSCSAHAFFDHYPSDWTPLALATDPTVPKAYSAKDIETGQLVSGSPYILVSGEGIRIESEITLSPSSATSPVGGEHTVTATVLKNKSPQAGKTVTFSIDSGPNVGKHGSAVTNWSGQASFTYKDDNGAGTDEISAEFTNDAGAVEKATASETWQTTQTTLSTSLSGAGKSGEEIAVPEGSAVSDSATLSGANAAKAAGTVTYSVYSDNQCKTLIAKAGEVTVAGGSVPSSSAQTLAAGATYYWQASYSGDSFNGASKSACGSEIETVQAASSLTTSLSGEGKTGEALTVHEGSPVTDQATLSGRMASTASGTVTYDVYSDNQCKTLIAKAGKVTVAAGSVPASDAQALAAASVYYWQASYSGDSFNGPSKSACGSEIETVQEATSLTTSLSGEGKTGEALTVHEGSPVRDQATLSGTIPPAGQPTASVMTTSTATGTVTYNVYSDNQCKTLIAKAGEVTVSVGNVPASNAQTLTAAAIYYWQASYSGDSLHQPSTSACGSEIETVQAASSLTTSLSAEGRSGAQLEAIEGSAVKDKATLSATHLSSAGGTVTYDVYSDKDCKTLIAKAGEVTVSAGSVPSSNEEKLTVGTYYWQASYSGDSLHQPATSACGAEVLTLKPYPTTTQLTLSPDSAEVGQTVTLSASITAAASCPGTVQFEVDGAPVGSPVTVHENAAQTTLKAPSAGAHTVTARYSGTLSATTRPHCLPSVSVPAKLTSTEAPAPPAAAGAQGPAPAGAQGLAATRHVQVCGSARRFVIHLQIPSRVRLLGTSVYIDGKLAGHLGANKRTYALNLSRRPYETVTVTLITREQGGRTVSGKRVYHTCRPHKLPGHTMFKL